MEFIGFTFIFFLLALGLAATVFWIWAFIKILQHNDSQGYQNGNQLIWVLVVLFLNLLGAVLYYFLEYRPRVESGRS